jgi:hypothetical protein
MKDKNSGENGGLVFYILDEGQNFRIQGRISPSYPR